MAQKQFTTYQADILSFDLREALLGVISPGRYSGYNVIAANGPVTSLIPFKIQHTGGIQKLAKGGSSLSAAIGVAVTTQGTIIHEDQEVTSLSVNDNLTGSYRYDLIYMQHDYTEVIGANPATYGIIQGTAGSGIPTLTNAYHRVLIGVMRLNPGAALLAHLTWYPAQSEKLFGDTGLAEKLWGDTNMANYLDSNFIGTIPADGILGSRTFATTHYITNNESLTAVIEDLDAAIYAEASARTSLGTRSLDHSGWGVLTDITQWNATVTEHGFLKKLDNNPYNFMNGQGNWAAPTGTRIKWRTGIPSGNDFTYDVTPGGVQDFNLSSIISETDVTLVLVESAIQVGSAGEQQIYIFYPDGESANVGKKCSVPPFVTLYLWYYEQFWVKVNSKILSITEGGISKSTSVGFKVIAWQTAQ